MLYLTNRCIKDELMLLSDVAFMLLRSTRPLLYNNGMRNIYCMKVIKGHKHSIDNVCWIQAKQWFMWITYIMR